MQQVLSQAIDTLAACFGVDATYCPTDGSPPKTVRVILKHQGHQSDIFASQVYTPAQQIQVQCKHVGNPQVGDVMIIEQTHYRLQSAPIPGCVFS